MADDFYILWLGLPPGPRPPHFYELLGLPLFAADRTAIDGAARGRLDRLDRFAIHPDREKREACTRLMTDVAKARVTLLDPGRKQSYDAQLAAQLGVPAPPPLEPLPEPPKALVPPVAAIPMPSIVTTPAPVAVSPASSPLAAPHVIPAPAARIMPVPSQVPPAASAAKPSPASSNASNLPPTQAWPYASLVRRVGRPALAAGLILCIFACGVYGYLKVVSPASKPPKTAAQTPATPGGFPIPSNSLAPVRRPISRPLAVSAAETDLAKALMQAAKSQETAEFQRLIRIADAGVFERTVSYLVALTQSSNDGNPRVVLTFWPQAHLPPAAQKVFMEAMLADAAQSSAYPFTLQEITGRSFRGSPGQSVTQAAYAEACRKVWEESLRRCPTDPVNDPEAILDHLAAAPYYTGLAGYARRATAEEFKQCLDAAVPRILNGQLSVDLLTSSVQFSGADKTFVQAARPALCEILRKTTDQGLAGRVQSSLLSGSGVPDLSLREGLSRLGYHSAAQRERLATMLAELCADPSQTPSALRVSAADQALYDALAAAGEARSSAQVAQAVKRADAAALRRVSEQFALRMAMASYTKYRTFLPLYRAVPDAHLDAGAQRAFVEPLLAEAASPSFDLEVLRVLLHNSRFSGGHDAEVTALGASWSASLGRHPQDPLYDPGRLVDSLRTATDVRQYVKQSRSPADRAAMFQAMAERAAWGEPYGSVISGLGETAASREIGDAELVEGAVRALCLVLRSTDDPAVADRALGYLRRAALPMDRKVRSASRRTPYGSREFWPADERASLAATFEELLPGAAAAAATAPGTAASAPAPVDEALVARLVKVRTVDDLAGGLSGVAPAALGRALDAVLYQSMVVEYDFQAKQVRAAFMLAPSAEFPAETQRAFVECLFAAAGDSRYKNVRDDVLTLLRQILVASPAAAQSPEAELRALRAAWAASLIHDAADPLNDPSRIAQSARKSADFDAYFKRATTAEQRTCIDAMTARLLSATQPDTELLDAVTQIARGYSGSSNIAQKTALLGFCRALRSTKNDTLFDAARDTLSLRVSVSDYQYAEALRRATTQSSSSDRDRLAAGYELAIQKQFASLPPDSPPSRVRGRRYSPVVPKPSVLPGRDAPP